MENKKKEKKHKRKTKKNPTATVYIIEYDCAIHTLRAHLLEHFMSPTWALSGSLAFARNNVGIQAETTIWNQGHQSTR